MSRSNKNIIKEAVADAAKVRSAAESVAKQKLIEQMAPSIRRIVESQINNAVEDVDRVRRAKDGHGENEKWEEGVNLEGDTSMNKDDENDLKDEGLGLENMFPGISEMDDADADDAEMDMGMGMEAAGPQNRFGRPQEESQIPTLGEMDMEDDMEGDMDEEIHIDEEGLRKAYEGIMALENSLTETSVDWSPDVSSGFKDTYPGTEWDTADGAPPSDKGLAGKEKSNAPWEKEKSPKAQDYTVKEAIKKGLAENNELRRYVSYLEEQLASAHKIVKALREEVSEVNLFNTKVLHVNEMLNNCTKLTKEQKKIVIEKIDSARNVREVKMVSESLKAAFGTTTSALKENAVRRPKATASRVQSSGSPNQKVLRESVNKNANTSMYQRWGTIAGLKQGK